MAKTAPPCLGVLFVLLPVSAFAQKLGGAPEPGGPAMMQLLVAFILCALFGAGLILLVKRRVLPSSAIGGRPSATFLDRITGPRKVRRMRVLETTALNPQTAIILLQWDDAEYLIGASAQNFVLLEKRPKPISEPAA